MYNLPFNMNTFNKLWGVVTPSEAKEKIEEQKKEFGIIDPKNLEEQAILLIGEIFMKINKRLYRKTMGKKSNRASFFYNKKTSSKIQL